MSWEDLCYLSETDLVLLSDNIRGAKIMYPLLAGARQRLREAQGEMERFLIAHPELHPDNRDNLDQAWIKPGGRLYKEGKHYVRLHKALHYGPIYVEHLVAEMQQFIDGERRWRKKLNVDWEEIKVKIRKHKPELLAKSPPTKRKNSD